MKRRQYILAGTGLVLAGCVGNDDPDVVDSDGDGVIDSEDYAPEDPDVQEKADIAGGSTGDSNSGETVEEVTTEPSTPEPTTTESTTTEPTTAESTTTTEATTTEPTTTESKIEFPSHSGTHAISGGKDFWSMELDIAVDFEIAYTVTNQKDEKHDFDVFVFDLAEYEDYLSKVGGGFTNPNAINKASVQNVKDTGERTATLAAGVYYFVVDNTDIGDAGDFGDEKTRKVHVELDTRAA